MRNIQSKIAAGGIIALLATCLVPALPAGAQNRAPQKNSQSSISIRDVETVYHRRALGNAYFNAQLRAQLVSQGLRFVANPRDADAILDSEGQYTGRGFIGHMTFFDGRGRVIWSQDVFRPDNSRVMAYQRLADQVRARRR